jgi:hypothetical protein
MIIFEGLSSANVDDTIRNYLRVFSRLCYVDYLYSFRYLRIGQSPVFGNFNGHSFQDLDNSDPAWAGIPRLSQV